MAWSSANPIPRANDVIQSVKGKIAQWWDNWYQEIAKRLDVMNVGSLALSGQTASVGATAIPPDTLTGTFAAGMYRVNYTARLTVAAGISSSLTTAYQWTSGGVSCSFSSAALTSNNTGLPQQATFPIKVDAGTSVSVTTTYSGSGSPTGTYALETWLEKMP